jgi:hypothetical protein
MLTNHVKWREIDVIPLPKEWISNTKTWKSCKILVYGPQFINPMLTDQGSNMGIMCEISYGTP